MTQLTLGQAAKATGRSKSTLTRAIKSGRLSAAKLDDGSYKIDPAELHRVYEISNPETVAAPVERNAAPPPDATPVAVLEVQLRAAQDALAREQDTVADLRSRLDRAEDRREAAEERLAGFLAPPPPAVRPGLLGRLLGR